jgi:hypothetical protein
MKRVPPDNVVPFDRPITLADLARAIEDLRALVEQMVVQPQPTREWLTIEQAAALVHRSPQAIRLRCRNGLGVKIAGKWRISRDQLFSQN